MWRRPSQSFFRTPASASCSQEKVTTQAMRWLLRKFYAGADGKSKSGSRSSKRIAANSCARSWKICVAGHLRFWARHPPAALAISASRLPSFRRRSPASCPRHRKRLRQRRTGARHRVPFYQSVTVQKWCLCVCCRSANRPRWRLRKSRS